MILIKECSRGVQASVCSSFVFAVTIFCSVISSSLVFRSLRVICLISDGCYQHTHVCTNLSVFCGARRTGMRRWCARRRWSFNWFSSWSRATIVFVWSNCSLTFVYSQLTLVSLDAFGGTEALPWVDVAHVGMAVTLAGCKRQKTKRKLKHLPQRRRWRRSTKVETQASFGSESFPLCIKKRSVPDCNDFSWFPLTWTFVHIHQP